MPIPLHPKLLDTLPGYGRSQFLHDVSAGITVGVLALPLAMAFAIASGMSPAAGIWTAIIAGLLISAGGGSRVQIGGPTGAFIPIVYGIVAVHGVGNLLIATMLAGLLLVLMAVTRMGSLIRFIPRTVVIGFTNGIAVVIFLAQIKDFLGLEVDKVPAEFFDKMHTLGSHLHTLDPLTAFMGIASLALLLGYNRLTEALPLLRRAPAPLIVLVFSTLATALFHLPVETIGSRFDGIPEGLPAISMPALQLDTLSRLIAPAITIALLGAIESLLSARVADGLIGDRHDPNQELMAQGLANLAAPLFGGFAATGAIARTATNIKSGGRTPVAGIVHSLTLLAIVLIAAPLARYIPLAALAAIVVMVSYQMGEWHEFVELRRYSVPYRVILLTTFLVTVVFDLTLAVELGMVLASLFFIFRMQDLTRAELRPADPAHPGITVIQLSGALFFGTVGKLEAAGDEALRTPGILVLDMTGVIALDTTALESLAALHGRMEKSGRQLILVAPQSQPASLLRRSGFAHTLGMANIHDNLASALQSCEGNPPCSPPKSAT
ncbi:MAG: STAS domain-containing protein [Proteobacteria bacterium]|nr:STAS domain-containing protein [Pseudomonadota bacterium]HQR04175.1 SulP family inorganic anion transporter [Rhodocyclaceae bacterium]